MSESRKIYLVTNSAYSEHHVLGAFATEAKAQEMVDLWPPDTAEIESFLLDELPEHPPGHLPFLVKIDIRAGTTECYRTDPLDTPIVPKLVVQGGLTGWLRAWARTGEHAIKIANEQRLRLLAGEGK